MSLPNPFLVASLLFAAFGCWAFVSTARKAKPHPKASRPVRLGIESALFAAGVAALLFGFAYAADAERVDEELIAVFGCMSVAAGLSYLICPFLGYNFVWNARIFTGAAPFIVIALTLMFGYMGLKAQFQF